jgi:hypothetical protein
MSTCIYTAQGELVCNEDSNKDTIEHFGASRWGDPSVFGKSNSSRWTPREPTVSRWAPTTSYTPTARGAGTNITSCRSSWVYNYLTGYYDTVYAC